MRNSGHKAIGHFKDRAPIIGGFGENLEKKYTFNKFKKNIFFENWDKIHKIVRLL